MFSQRGTVDKRGFLVSIVAFGALAYAGVMLGMSHLGVVKAPTSVSHSTHKSTLAAAGNVPNGILHHVATQLKNVAGVNELYVQAAPTGGYIVSATAQVGPQATDKQVKNLMSQYLEDLYSSSLNISDAEIYVLQHGMIVAGAGLGSDVYHKLASTTGTKPFFLVQHLKSPGVTSQGANNDWIESQIPASP